MKRALLFLDFDGVICDSIDECLVSSWIAFHRMTGPDLPPGMDVGLRRSFAAMRPFIRSGEDYVVIQELIAEGRRASSQAEFDAAAAARGGEGMALRKRVFYEARGGLLESDRPWWLALNRVYPHVRRPLAALAPRPDTVVLSTKKSEFIVEILAANGVPMPIERVLYTGSRAKVDIIAGLLGPADTALLIDDQIDHLLARRDPRIDVRLALWGYIRPEWLDEHRDVPRVTEETFEETVGPWLTRPRRAGA